MFRLTAFLVFALSACVASAEIVMEMVPVGNPGNAADNTGYGSVDQAYAIGKYEVTAGQYTEFLNAVAANDDPHGLYNELMWSRTGGCKIERTGVAGSYRYFVAPDRANRPVNYLSFWDAVRFTNWLHNGQGNGNTETGAYTLTQAGIDANTVSRNPDARVWIPSEDQWYKAAYYDSNNDCSVSTQMAQSGG